jgi:hypothetical protein
MQRSTLLGYFEQTKEDFEVHTICFVVIPDVEKCDKSEWDPGFHSL